MRQIFSDTSNIRTGEIELGEIYSVPELNFPAEGVSLARESNQPLKVESKFTSPVVQRPYLYFNMVSSIDGKITTRADNAEGLGTRSDRGLMQRLRMASDAVLIGSNTFRHDPFIPDVKPEFAVERQRYFPNQPQPLALVLSGDGNLPLDNKFFRATRERRLIFLGPQATPEAEQRLAERAQIFRLGADSQGRPDLKQLLEIAWKQLKVRWLLVEGGPTLNYAFISQGWADEFFWTLAPKMVGGSQNLSAVEGPGKGFELGQLPNLHLISIYEQESELFMRYRFRK